MSSQLNRQAWDAEADAYQDRHADDLSAMGGEAWGVWRLPESELQILGDVEGLDVLELGCGAAQWSIALARRGARVTGLDNSGAQLGHARAAVEQAGVDVRLVHAPAESTSLPGASFDVVFCDHGAFNFAEPGLLICESARLLRRGGLLAWMWGTPVLEAAWPVDAEHPTTELTRDIFGMGRFRADGMDSFMQAHSVTFRQLREAGFIVEDLLEPQPPADAASTYRSAEDLAWARRWPMEEVWRARRQ
jgi:SAM-dependent methyltransferase